MPEEKSGAAGGSETGRLRRAAFAGGCFWCMEHAFDQVRGVVSVTPGYTGGHKKDPTYDEVSSGQTGHAEAVLVVYDPEKVDYERLLDVFWRNIDPTVRDRQFCDVGPQYRTAVFYFSERQRRLAEESLVRLQEAVRLEGPVATVILPAGEFYPAEEYHRKYYLKNPNLYEAYRAQCGRDLRLGELWGDAAGAGKESDAHGNKK